MATAVQTSYQGGARHAGGRVVGRYRQMTADRPAFGAPGPQRPHDRCRQPVPPQKCVFRSRRLGEIDQIVTKNGVKIVGIANLPARVAADASALYARNVLNFLALSLNPKTGEFKVPKDDEIIAATLVCENGHVAAKQ